MSKLLKLSQQTLWQMVGKVISSVATFIILGIVARSYGETGTGAFTLVTTYLGIFYLLADFGFNAHVLSQGNVEKQWGKLLGARLLWAGVLVIISLSIFPLMPFASSLLFASVLFGSLD